MHFALALQIMQPALCLAPETLHCFCSAPTEDGYLSARDILLHVFIYMLVSLPSLGTPRGRLVSSAPSTELGTVEMCGKCFLSKLTNE